MTRSEIIDAIYSAGFDTADTQIIFYDKLKKLYHLAFKAGAKSEREPLTEEQIEDIWEKAACYEDDTLNIVAFARDIEAAHGIAKARGAE